MSCEQGYTIAAKRGPTRVWQVRDTRVGMYGWLYWDMSRHGRGVTARTPWTAWWRLRRWLREPSRPM